MKYTYTELAGMIDHALLHPTMTEAEMRAGCEMAAQYKVASVCIKPYAVRLAAEILQGSGVAVGTVIGFPHGGASTEVKRYETEVACRSGATEIDMVANIGAALSGDWETVETDIRAVVEEAHRHGALVKVIFENGYLTDPVKIGLCQASESAGAEFVKTSTGFGFVKGSDGNLIATGATEADLRLMLANVSPKVQVKAAGGVRDLDTLIAVRDLGVTRCGTSSTVQILEEYRKREAAGETAASGSGTMGGGY
ncbi:MAG: deoxyribose-phosphate aldolase [Verrucomicrobiaceae bacterium]|nr:MAG: deoxyribose-phosphate aldolase [Verrucomicrobiaceae bacterium]